MLRSEWHLIEPVNQAGTLHLLTIKDEKKGFFIVLDDINGLAETPDFANWYKSFVDKVATRYEKFPVTIMLCGLPEIRDKLSTHQESLMRIFRVFQIKKLENEEVSRFFLNTFNKVNMKINDNALINLVHYSSGLPILMHEIGDSIFWIDKDNVVDNKDAFSGIFKAAENIGRKYLEPKVYNAVKSERYKSILRKIGKTISSQFKRKDIVQKLNKSEESVFDFFLKKMRTLGVIEEDKKKGEVRIDSLTKFIPFIFL